MNGDSSATNLGQMTSLNTKKDKKLYEQVYEKDQEDIVETPRYVSGYKGKDTYSKPKEKEREKEKEKEKEREKDT